MPKIVDYLIIREFLLPDFHEHMAVALSDGFQPYGNLQVSAVYNPAKQEVNRAYAQAMVRFEEDSK